MNLHTEANNPKLCLHVVVGCLQNHNPVLKIFLGFDPKAFSRPPACIGIARASMKIVSLLLQKQSFLLRARRQEAHSACSRAKSPAALSLGLQLRSEKFKGRVVSERTADAVIRTVTFSRSGLFVVPGGLRLRLRLIHMHPTRKKEKKNQPLKRCLALHKLLSETQ